MFLGSTCCQETLSEMYQSLEGSQDKFFPRNFHEDPGNMSVGDDGTLSSSPIA